MDTNKNVFFVRFWIRFVLNLFYCKESQMRALQYFCDRVIQEIKTNVKLGQNNVQFSFLRAKKPK